MLFGASFGENTAMGVDVSGLIDASFAHFAVVFSPDPGVESVYVNGQPVPESVDSAFNHPFIGLAGFSIGRRLALEATAEYLAGTIDDFAIFNGRLNCPPSA